MLPLIEINVPTYTAEDGNTVYTAEDGLTPYIVE